MLFFSFEVSCKEAAGDVPELRQHRRFFGPAFSYRSDRAWICNTYFFPSPNKAFANPNVLLGCLRGFMGSGCGGIFGCSHHSYGELADSSCDVFLSYVRRNTCYFISAFSTAVCDGSLAFLTPLVKELPTIRAHGIDIGIRASIVFVPSFIAGSLSGFSLLSCRSPGWAGSTRNLKP